MLWFREILSLSLRGGGWCALRRDRVDDAVAAALEGAQQRRDHCRGLGPGVMQQHDAPARGLNSTEQELKLLGGRHRIPVARPQIGAEYDDPSALQHVEQGR